MADRPYTEADFARDAARIAKEAATWAAECIEYPDWRERPMRQEPASRFIATIRERLLWIEEKVQPAIEVREIRRGS